MEDAVTIGGPAYLGLLALLVFSRGMDMLSTWVATPNLVLEGNPLAKKLGWRGNIALGVVVSVVFAVWPIAAVIISTTSILVAARNFQQAWLMRSLGEGAYRQWHMGRLQDARMSLYLLCLAGQTALTASVGVALIYFSPTVNAVSMAIGIGIVGYAGAVAFYTLLSVWRLRRAVG